MCCATVDGSSTFLRIPYLPYLLQDHTINNIPVITTQWKNQQL